MRKILTILCLILVPLVLLGACRPAPPAPAPAPQPPPTMPAPLPPENQPPQDELSFHLSSTAIPGDTDAYAVHSFALRLEANQRLSLAFKAVGAKVLVSIYTPTPETWGYYSSSAASPEMGVLEKGRLIASEEGSATFTTAISRTTMNWTTLRSASAGHLRRSVLTMSSPASLFLWSLCLQPSRVNLRFARRDFTTARTAATLRA